MNLVLINNHNGHKICKKIKHFKINLRLARFFLLQAQKTLHLEEVLSKDFKGIVCRYPGNNL